MQPAYKVCPDCSSEFQLSISHCSDCGTALVWPGDIPQWESLPAGPELVRLREIEPWSADEIADALRRARIRFRLEVIESAEDDPQIRRRKSTSVAILVRRADYSAACDVDAEVMARRAPEYAEREVREELDANACPGCAAPLDPGAASCAACGLAFPE